MSIMLFSMLWACSGKSDEDSAVESQPASEPAEEPADSGSEPEDTAVGLAIAVWFVPSCAFAGSAMIPTA